MNYLMRLFIINSDTPDEINNLLDNFCQLCDLPGWGRLKKSCLPNSDFSTVAERHKKQ